MDIFFAEHSLPFSVSLLVMLGLSILEGIAFLLSGTGLSGAVDGILDLQPSDGDFLGWLHVGRVPLLMLLLIFLTAFGLTGLFIQSIASRLLGTPLPAVIASVPALFFAVPMLRGGGMLLERILPRDETAAVSLDALVGRAGIVVGAPARPGVAAQIRVRDEHGRSHYVMAEPDDGTEVLEDGAEVLLVRRLGARYRAIPNPHRGLLQP
ncbi:hypothetical protein AZSI13_13280 [Azospira sp. I13]|uniref:YqiJ family protein n=1 Tax=Azospira sp. I13 TaxID=1765050 RepID=UPI000D480719|nr:YqiJ family protein [Azospira sp. I13]GBG02001.1 hypothetical protein AZSI13_13280 [Azospira sp. I13]